MRTALLTLLIPALFSTAALAKYTSLENADSKNCEAIVKACETAGFVRNGADGKRFWQDCMRPIILGTSVKNVAVDPAKGEACRMDKILQLKAELKDLENTKI